MDMTLVAKGTIEHWSRKISYNTDQTTFQTTQPTKSRILVTWHTQPTKSKIMVTWYKLPWFKVPVKFYVVFCKDIINIVTIHCCFGGLKHKTFGKFSASQDLNKDTYQESVHMYRKTRQKCISVEFDWSRGSADIKLNSSGTSVKHSQNKCYTIKDNRLEISTSYPQQQNENHGNLHHAHRVTRRNKATVQWPWPLTLASLGTRLGL